MKAPMTASSAAAFLSELVRAANEIDRLTKNERAGLMQRAANTIRDMRDQVASYDGPANDNDPDDIECSLRDMSSLIDVFAAREIAAKLLQAAEAIRTLSILLGIKDEVLRGE